jgi:hypothetical protein
METRIRTEYDLIDEECKTYVNGSYVFSDVGQTVRNFQWMHDTHGNHTGFNPCTNLRGHQSKICPPDFVVEIPGEEENPPSTMTISHTGDISFWDLFESYNLDPDSWDGDFPFGFDPLPPSSVGPFIRASFDNALKQMPMEIDIVNFLTQLPNPKRWWKLAKRMTKWAATNPGDALLWWQFEVKPFISDIKSLIHIFKKVRNRLDYLRKVNGRTVTLRSSDGNVFSMEDDTTDYGPIGEWEDPITDAWRNRTFRVSLHQTDIHLNLKVKYNLTGLEGPLAWMDMMASALGLLNPAGIIWERIPWSFAVDWFVGVGDFLDKTSMEPFKGLIAVVGADHTLITRTLIHTMFPTGYDSEWESGGYQLVQGYFRRSGVPPNAAEWDGLTPTQMALAAALLQQVGVKSRRRRKMKSPP